MPFRWQRTINFVAAISAVVLVARLRFELDYSWTAAICSAVIVAMPFIITRLWIKYTSLRTESAASGMRCRQRLNSMLSQKA